MADTTAASNTVLVTVDTTTTAGIVAHVHPGDVDPRTAARIVTAALEVEYRCDQCQRVEWRRLTDRHRAETAGWRAATTVTGRQGVWCPVCTGVAPEYWTRHGD